MADFVFHPLGVHLQSAWADKPSSTDSNRKCHGGSRPMEKPQIPVQSPFFFRLGLSHDPLAARR